MFFLAFLLHYSYLWYGFAGPSHCRTMNVSTSFVFFTPQAIFFLIFIWTIFKLLVIWRGMVANSDKDAVKERKRLNIFRLCYYVIWCALWFTQRTSEAMTIDEKMTDHKNGQGSTTTLLFVSNICELVIELALYAALIKVSINFNKFLFSFS